MKQTNSGQCDRRTLIGRITAVLVGGLAGASFTPRATSAARGVEPFTGGVEPFIGEISLIPYNFAPRGWAFCEGQLLSVSQRQSLFSLLGTTYGGDGRATFALPDLRPLERQMVRHNEAPTFRHIISLIGIYPSRS
ncbi:MAG: tail fiber protein [Gemmatimonadota bacterium]